MFLRNKVFLLGSLFFVQECLSDTTPFQLLIGKKSEKSQLWPFCLLNNKWVPYPGNVTNYTRPTRPVSNYNNYQFQLSPTLPLNLLRKLPLDLQEKVKRPVSIAAGILKPVLKVLPHKKELLSYNNNNIFNSYYSTPNIEFPTATQISHSVSPAPAFYYSTVPYGIDQNLGGQTNMATISPSFPIQLEKEITESTAVNKNREEQTVCLKYCTETGTQNATFTVKNEANFSNHIIANIMEETTTPSTSAEVDSANQQQKIVLLERFTVALDNLDRLFYYTTFNKLLSISPPERAENGISFVQSGLFLSMFLMALSTLTDAQTATEIDTFIGINSNAEKKELIKEIIATLPKSNVDLRWRWSSRLVLGSHNVTQMVNNSVTAALQLRIAQCNDSETPENLANTLNRMVEEDSGGAIRETFEPEEMSEGFQAAAITVLYFRARWFSAPTVLNGTRLFRDELGSPTRTMRMIRINDVMRYANLEDWSCQAIEISYATPGLTLLILVPNQTSLRSVALQLNRTSISDITSRMEKKRIAVSMPIYTLRMTLLLPSKLQSMGVSSLVNLNSKASDLRLSHAIQRIMFWAEAGRNAFKDDGIEWDRTPELELVVDRPYLFFVRWHNLTLMNGNFVL